jgi:hypothetical protein
LLVAISRSQLLTIVVSSTALFEVTAEDSEHLDDGPIWVRLFTQAVSCDPDPAWAGPLGEFTDRGIGTEDREQAVVAALEQLFTGLRVSLPTLMVQCCCCGTQLDDGEQVSVYAYRTVETPRWHLACCRCPDCAPNDIETPTLGTTEVRLSARLAVVSDVEMQQHRLCLVDPTVTAAATPTAGTPR